MKKILLFVSVVLLSTSCNKSLFVSNGSKDNRPLLFQNEYELKNLNEITVEGEAFCGIPSFTKNNQNNHHHGFLFTFNGIEIGSVRRVLPIITGVGLSFISASLVQKIGGKKQITVNNPPFGSYTYEDGYKIKTVPALILGLPLAGIINNHLWSQAAVSGASATLNYRLLTENPNVDLFFYPKYEIQYHPGVFTQKATLKARITGATLKKK